MLPISAILVLLVSSLTFADEQPGAPKAALKPNQVIPLVTHGKYNYFIGTTFKATQLQALRFCKNINMSLLDIESEDENDAIYNFIKDINGDLYYWGSGSRIIDGKNWLWLSNGKQMQYTHWDNGQPSTNDEYCVSLKIDKSNNKLVWHDDVCSYEKPFICKAAADKNAEEKPNVWSNIFENGKGLISDEFVYGEKYYYFARQFKGTFAQGYQFCDAIGMRPVSVLSEDENNRIYKHLRDTNAEEKWWTSGARSTDSVHWFWLSNGKLVNYTNWAVSEPNNRLSEQCLALVLNKDKGLYFFDIGCNVQHPVICGKPVKQSKLSKRAAEKRWLNHAQKLRKTRGALGKYYAEYDFKATHEEALEYCQFLDMQLTEIKTSEKSDIITRELLVVPEKGPFYISGKRFKDDWVLDSNNEKIVYTNWLAGRPQEELNYGCIQVNHRGKWVDVNCDAESPFVCEKPDVEQKSDDCPQPVINVYINNNVPAQEQQSFVPIRVDDKSSGDEHSVLVKNKWDTCSN